MCVYLFNPTDSGAIILHNGVFVFVWLWYNFQEWLTWLKMLETWVTAHNIITGKKKKKNRKKTFWLLLAPILTHTSAAAE